MTVSIHLETVDFLLIELNSPIAEQSYAPVGNELIHSVVRFKLVYETSSPRIRGIVLANDAKDCTVTYIAARSEWSANFAH